MKSIIVGNNINKVHSTQSHSQHVLKNISLTIKEGEYVTIMGASGSGKSTLLYSLSAMDTITSGDIQFLESNLSNASEKELTEVRLNQMGFIFQQPHLLKDLSIKDNILLPGYSSEKYSNIDVAKRCDMLLKDLGIEDIGEHKIHQVSGGQLQRASIARALINDPQIIFGDEPTGALNSKATLEVLSIIQKIHDQGKTVLLVTHDAKVALMSERVLYMQDGEIVSELVLGKYHTSKKDTRQHTLNTWLLELGF